MVNFRIVENPQDNLDEIYPEFKEDFLDETVLVADLKKKYSLSNSRYKTLRDRVFNETGLTQKPCKMGGREFPLKKTSFIKKYRNGRCIIYKTVNGVKKSFGTYEDLETAQLVRDKLIESNWDDDVAEELKKKYIQPRIKPSLQSALPKMDEFEKLYLNGDSIDDIVTTLNITRYQYTLLSKEVRKKHNLLSKRQKREKASVKK